MRVDFYLLKDTAPRARARFACRLAEKAFGLGQRVHIHCGDATEVEQLDALLWTFRDRAFVPHAADGSDEPVVIGSDEPRGPGRPMLINLAAEVPEWYARFERVAEIVTDEDAEKAAGRARYRRYREHGHAPETHELEAGR